MDKQPLIERAISAISPRWGASRAKAASLMLASRLAIDGLRSYEAAGQGKRNESWYAPSTSANGETGFSLSFLRDRHRQLVRDNPICSRAVEAIEANVGVMTPVFTGADAPLAKALWKRFSESTDCDAGGQHDYNGLQSLVMRSTPESGEILARRRYRRPSDNLPVPMQIQLLESDFLDSSAGMMGAKDIVQGVEFDRLGRRTKYHLFNNHPGDEGFISVSSSPVPAKDIAHVYRIDRPGQVRGVPWGASVMLRIRGFDEFEDAHLMRQKIAACFTAFVTDMQGEPTPGSKPAFSDKIGPGLIKRLGAGEDVTLANPPSVDGYGEYCVEQKHAFASGYGIPYALLTGDRRKSNFSNSKMDRVDFLRNLTKWRQRILRQQFCEPTMRWFLQAARLDGHKLDDVSVAWTAPREMLLDLAREIPPIIKGIENGIFTLPEIHRSIHGCSSDEVVDEIQESNKALKESGLGGLIVGALKESPIGNKE